MLATRLSVNASNRGDSLAVYASAEDLYAGVLHLPHLSLTGGAEQGRVQLSAGFDDTLRTRVGTAWACRRTWWPTSTAPTAASWTCASCPRTSPAATKTWQIYARKILLDTAQVVIDRFFVMNREQELLLDGVASRSREDSVTLAPAQLRPRAFHAGRRALGVRRRGAHERFRDDEIRAAHAGEISADILLDSRGGQRHSRAAAAALFALGFLAQPRRGDASPTVTSAIRLSGASTPLTAGALLRPAGHRQSRHGAARPDAFGRDFLRPRALASAELVLQGQRRDADLDGDGFASRDSRRKSILRRWPIRCPKPFSTCRTTASARRTFRSSTPRATGAVSTST